MTSARLVRSAAAAAAILTLAPWASAGIAAQGIPVRLGGELSSLPGVPIDVPLIIDMTGRPAEKVGAFAARFTWNPAVLQLDAVNPGSFGSITPSLDSAASGVLRLAGANPAGVDGIITLGSMRFTPLIVDTTTISFAMSQLYAAGTFADLLPFVTASGGAYCSAQGRYGDLNANGAANGFDALVVLTAAVGLPPGPYNLSLADVDANGSTSTRDALIILSHAVGLDVSAFRVLQLAPGGCTLAGLSTLAVTPGVVADILPGQVVRFEARATGAGGITTLVNATWTTDNAGVIQISSAGIATAQAPGSATIRAVRDGIDTVAVAVTVIGRRSRHIADAASIAAANQLGTAALPFGLIRDATLLAQDGDTIQVKPGRYDEGITIGVAALLAGDTLPDGTRPTIAGVDTGGVAVRLTGTGERRIRDIAVSGNQTGFTIRGPAVVRFDGIRTSGLMAGIRADSSLTLLEVRNSRLGGATLAGYGHGIDVEYHRADTVLVDSTAIGDFSGDGVRVLNWDMVTFRRSQVHDVGGSGLFLGDYYADTSGFAGNDIVVEWSSFARIDENVMQLYGFRDAAMRHNLAVGSNEDLYYAQYGRTLRITGDSIDFDDYYYWLDANRLDSIFVDSVRANLGDADGYVYDTRYLSVTNSVFRNVSDEVIEMYYGVIAAPGGRADIANVVIEGAVDCYLCATGFYLQDVRATVDRLTVRNAYTGVELDGDSSLTVTNSLFEDIEYPLQYYGYYGTTGGITVTNSTFRRVEDWAIEAWNGAITVDSNTFDGGYSVLDGGGTRPISVTRNRVMGFEQGFFMYAYDSSGTHTASDNVITGLRDDEAIYAEGEYYADTLQIRWLIQRNTIACAAGSYYGEGIRVDAADAVVSDNVISGCRWGIDVGTAYDTVQRSDSILRNTITLAPNSSSYGIRLRNHVRGRISQNVISGDTMQTSYNVDGIRLERDYYNCVYYAYYRCDLVVAIDSNTVSNLRGSGIRVTGADSLLVADNTVTDIAYGYGYNGGIVVSAVQHLARIHGNTVRRATDAGIRLNPEGVDTATIGVDSNLVRQSGSGLRLYQGSAIASYNRFADNLGDGIIVEYGSLTAAFNNITGNAYYGLREYGVAVAASQNWWGDPLGPRCAAGCDSTSTGDSVSANVTWAPPLTSEATTPPLTAPVALRAARPVTAVASPAAAQQFSGTPSPRQALRADTTLAPTARRAALDRIRAERNAARERREAERRAEHQRAADAARARRAQPARGAAR